jgi:superfamily II DNA/RNA helicase
MIHLKVILINIDPEEYLHRVGRTARGADASGKALMLLLPNEMSFIRYLKQNNVNIQLSLDKHK